MTDKELIEELELHNTELSLALATAKGKIEALQGEVNFWRMVEMRSKQIEQDLRAAIKEMEDAFNETNVGDAN